jgi:diguanylate cyclase (GGDEF)-like protein
MSIIIVDDSPIIIKLLGTMLGNAGYKELLFADSAFEAFKQLGIDDSAYNLNADLILMDISMPEIDGIEACRRIKAIESLQDIPIIMVTAETDVKYLEKAFDAGAMDYITKPPSETVLLARVRSALKLKCEMDRRKAREQELLESSKALQESYETLWKLFSIDGLTGIANRRRFDEAMNWEFRRAVRENTPLSLIMIDVDFFKNFNDTYGHQQGDICLRQVAGALRQVLQRAGDMVARYGGEEFAAILPSTKTKGAVVVAEAMRLSVESLQVKHGSSSVSLWVTISLGTVTTTPDRHSSCADLINAADKALYEAKREGRNRVKVVSINSPETPEDERN